MPQRNPEIPESPDAEGVQDRLVRAGEALFCERGFNETSVRDIAAAAGCNVASINYYFGGKDKLYVEVWRRRLASIREVRLRSINAVMSGPGRPQLEALLESYAGSVLDPLVDGDQGCRFVHLMAREMMDSHLPPGMLVEEMVRPVMTALAQALREICPWLKGVNVQPIILSIAGQLVHTVCATQMFEGSNDPELPVPDLATMIDHVVRFSAGGIRAYADGKGEETR